VVFAKCEYPLLAGVLRTFQYEDTGRLNAILDKELGLEIGLREVFEEHTGLQFLGKMCDQSCCLLLVILFREVVSANELGEVHHFHVGTLGKCFSEYRLACTLRPDQERDLGEDGLPRIFVDFVRVADSINLVDLAEAFIHGDDGLGLVDIVLESTHDSGLVIVSASASLCTIHAPSNADILIHIVVEHSLCFAAGTLEVHGLV
jgi:hypothetical protein